MKFVLLILVVGVSHGFFLEKETGPWPNPWNSQFWENFKNSMMRNSFNAELNIGGMDTIPEESSIVEHSYENGDSASDHHMLDDWMTTFFRQNQPWWKGENVCVTRTESDDIANNTNSNTTTEGNVFASYHMSSCKETGKKYKCTTKLSVHGIQKSFQVTYECCHGFQRQPGQPGCMKVDLSDLLTTIRDVTPNFAYMLQSSGLSEDIKNKNFTVFASKHDSWESLVENENKVTEEPNISLPPASERRKRDTRQGKGIDVDPNLKKTLLNHIIAEIHDLQDLENDQILISESGHPLRINIYPSYDREPVYTVNCGRITIRNRLATNGIVHVVDNTVLTPNEMTIAQRLKQDPNFSILYSLLQNKGMLDELDRDGSFTLFAPTNEAFEKLDREALESYRRGENCIDKILRHHEMNQVLCTSGVKHTLTLITRDGEKYQIYTTDDGLFVDQAKIVKSDVIATNGAIHGIDKVILPNAGRRISEVLSNRNLTTFKKYLEDANMLDELDRSENITLFVPTEAAFLDPDIKKYLEEIQGDKNKLKDMMMYHVTEKIESCDFQNEKDLISKSGQHLRLNLYSSDPIFSLARPKATISCARIRSYETKACGGTVNEIDRLLVPPSGNALDSIQARDEEFSIFNKLINGTELEDILTMKSPITVLAPTDAAFNKLSTEELDVLLNNKTKATEVLKQHIIPESLCCNGISSDSWPWTHQVPSMGGTRLTTRKDQKGRVHFGPMRVVKCDQITTNGIIHTVNKLFVPKTQSVNLFNMFHNLNPFMISGVSNKNPNVNVGIIY